MREVALAPLVHARLQFRAPRSEPSLACLTVHCRVLAVAFVAEPAELAMLRTETERAWQAMGGVVFGGTAAEKKSLAFRRSLYVVKDM